MCVVTMKRKLCTRIKTFKEVYYKHVMTINHTRCDTVCLEVLVNIGDVRNLEINIRMFETNVNMLIYRKVIN